MNDDITLLFKMTPKVESDNIDYVHKSIYQSTKTSIGYMVSCLLFQKLEEYINVGYRIFASTVIMERNSHFTTMIFASEWWVGGTFTFLNSVYSNQ